MNPEDKTIQWSDVASRGDQETLARLLAESPHLLDSAGTSALEAAAKAGQHKVVAQLLTAGVDPMPAIRGQWNALHIAAAFGHDKVVELLLAAQPNLVSLIVNYGLTALHEAASSGNERSVALLLAAEPSLVRTPNKSGSLPLHFAAEVGHEKIVAQLLAADPSLITSTDNAGATLLHAAATNEHTRVIKLLLAIRPELLTSVTRSGWTALHIAVASGAVQVAELILEIKPELISDLVLAGSSILHLAMTHECSDEFILKLWRLHPQALHTPDACGRIPFHFAIREARDEVVNVLQWRLTFDEIMTAFEGCPDSLEKRYWPVMEELCESLVDSVSHDVTGIVFEYLGFDTQLVIHSQ